MEPIVLSSLDGETVLREWRKPVAAHRAAVPRRKPTTLPDSWTVVTTATGVVNAWAGDVPLVTDGNHSCGLSQLVRVTARTPFSLLARCPAG